MPSRGTFLRARLPLCAIAAVGLHAFAAQALPRRHRKATVAVPVADAPAPSLDLVEEESTTDEPAAPEVKEEKRPEPSPAPARATPPPAAKTKIESAPDDSASESMVASTTGEGTDTGGEGANGDGDGARGGAGEGGGRDGPVEAPPGPAPGKPHRPPGAAKLDISRDWSKCPFPEQTKRDRAFVRLQVTVGPLGEAVEVKVLADPGDGFGAAASACAKIHRYVAGKNEDGVAEKTETDPFIVFFTR